MEDNQSNEVNKKKEYNGKPRGRPKGSLNKKKIEKKSKPIKSKYQCPKCKRNLKEQNFYNTRNTLLQKYPMCKACLLETVDFLDPNQFISILKDMNLPFIKDLYMSCVTKYPDTAFQQYMKNVNSLPQYRHFTYKDGYVDLEQFKADMECKFNDSQQIKSNEITIKKTDNKNKVERREPDVHSFHQIYSTEWLGSYTEWELHYLENYLKDLKNDFKIINRNHLDYAKKIAKSSLAMDKAYDEMVNGKGDAGRYKTLKETFDTLCKSAQFSENQRGVNDVGLGDFGSVFDRVEKNTFVYEYVPDEKDIYDLLLEQFSNIKKSL